MIDFIRETALKAGKKSLEYFGNLQAGDVSGKGTANDLVSVADKAVELYEPVAEALGQLDLP